MPDSCCKYHLDDARGVTENRDRASAAPARGGTARRALLRAALIALAVTSLALPGSAGAATADPLAYDESKVQAGEDYFVGRNGFDNGAAACVACHTVSGIDGLGGGRLGPDLTQAFATYGGAAGLGGWLMAPSSKTMLPIYGPKQKPLAKGEIEALAAYLGAQSAGKGGSSGKASTSAAPDRTKFLGGGFIAFIVVLGLFKGLWNRRMRGVRKPLVQSAKLPE